MVEIKYWVIDRTPIEGSEPTYFRNRSWEQSNLSRKICLSQFSLCLNKSDILNL